MLEIDEEVVLHEMVPACWVTIRSQLKPPQMTKRKKKLCWATADRCKLAFNIWKILFKNFFFFFLLLLTSLYLPFKFIGHNQYGVLQPYSENIKKYNSSGDKRGFLQKNNQKKKIKPDQIKPNRTKPNQIKIGNGTAFLQLLSSDDWNWL